MTKVQDLPAVLTFKNVSFSYPSRPDERALDEFSLKYPSFEVVKINMDKNKNIADSFSVNSVPTILAFNKNVKYFSFTGFIDLENLIKSIQK